MNKLLILLLIATLAGLGYVISKRRVKLEVELEVEPEEEAKQDGG